MGDPMLLYKSIRMPGTKFLFDMKLKNEIDRLAREREKLTEAWVFRPKSITWPLCMN